MFEGRDALTIPSQAVQLSGDAICDLHMHCAQLSGDHRIVAYFDGLAVLYDTVEPTPSPAQYRPKISHMPTTCAAKITGTAPPLEVKQIDPAELPSPALVALRRKIAADNVM